MAEKKERKPEEEPEMKIPVFTVIKNGAILKNIFLINKPLSPQSITSVKNEENPDQENGEEILIVGRHPDCHIMLTHPSISRFHVQIQIQTSSKKLSVIDLSSVHGTWVSETKIEPGVPVGLNEGDTIKIGGSTRVYRLHWVSLSQAYDMDNPFVSPLDMSMTETKEVESEALEEENEAVTHQGGNSVSIENGKTEVQHSLAVEAQEENTCQGVNSTLIEINQTEGNASLVVDRQGETNQDEISSSIEDEATQSLELILEGIVSLFSDDDSGLILKKGIPSSGVESVVLSLPVGFNISVSDEQQLDKDNRIPGLDSVKDVISERENAGSFLKRAEKNSEAIVNLVSPCDDVKEEKILQEMESQSTLQKDNELRDDSEVWSGPLMKESKNLSLVLGEAPSEIETEQFKEEKQTLHSLAAWQSLSETGNKENSYVDHNLNLMMNQNYECFDEENCWPAAEMHDEAENQNALRQGHVLTKTRSFNSILLEAESVNSSLPCGEELSKIADSKIYQTPQSLYAPEGFSENSENSPLRTSKRSSMHSIWTRRGKPASVLQIQTSRSRGKTKGDCNNGDVEFPQRDKMENESILKIPFSGLEGMEEETFTPDKENFTPDTLSMKSSKRKGKHSRSGLSKFTCSPNIQAEELTLTSDKENQTPKVLREQKLARDISRSQLRLEQERVLMKNRAERVPFQPLLVNSAGKRRSEMSLSNATTRSSNSVNFTQTTKVSNSSSVCEGRRCWTIVVDTTTLVDKESRKSLQLLQGLKGTQLIIPRMVIRELDCMKRQSLFRRTSEVSSSFEWIEECMVKTKGWIHIQSSVEEGRSIVPTPPVSPHSQLSEESGGFFYGTTSWTRFLSCTNLTEIVSPTAEDHILYCALLFRKMKNDGQFVLLSNNVTMKIKAMAEGLICETAQEFRESLVNPFSERFLWADSSPRGRTWSYLDDIVLRDKYNRVGHLKKPSKGGDSAKGLKLILLHNSHYNAHISSVR